jgi:hypothetical protein
MTLKKIAIYTQGCLLISNTFHSQNCYDLHFKGEKLKLREVTHFISSQGNKNEHRYDRESLTPKRLPASWSYICVETHKVPLST